MANLNADSKIVSGDVDGILSLGKKLSQINSDLNVAKKSFK
jgi:hypothetical protein